MTKALVTERGVKYSCLGPVLQLKINTPDYVALSWSEVWSAFTEAYPNRWAVQVFPPRSHLVDGKNVYHLWVLPKGETLEGLDLR